MTFPTGMPYMVRGGSAQHVDSEDESDTVSLVADEETSSLGSRDEEFVDEALASIPEDRLSGPTEGREAGGGEGGRAAAGEAVSGSKSSSLFSYIIGSKKGGGRKVDVGLGWHLHVVPDDYFHPKHCDATTKELKPRRPLPQIRASEFFSNLEQDSEGRWEYKGPALNGWPALLNLHVIHVTGKIRRRMTLTTYVRRFWDAAKAEDANIAPFYPDRLRYVRIKAHSPPWSIKGWTADSPGYVFWAAMQKPTSAAQELKLKVFHGESMLRAARDGVMSDLPNLLPASETLATRVHVVAHRYAHGRRGETAKDKVTYHAAVLLEWSHGQFGTIVELAWLNGLGGYGGKSNWYRDKDTPMSSLFHAMPRHMQAPWHSNRSEIRVLDVPMRSREELQAYLDEYTGTDKRFLSPDIFMSEQVQLSHRSQADIMRYLINYVLRYPEYHEESMNCQTFAADFSGFLVGKKHVEPYHQICRVLYKSRQFAFLYGPPL